MSRAFEWREAPAADFGVIGDPVAHSLSPRMHRAAYAALGLLYAYEQVRVPPGEVGEALDHLASLGYRGVNVTVPHKEECLGWVAEAEPFCTRSGSSNALDLNRRIATNTDAPGFLDTLVPLGIEAGASVLLLGSGGSARALALALSDRGFRLAVWARAREKAHRMVERLAIDADVLEDPVVAGKDLVINATSAGVLGGRLDIGWSDACVGAVAYDLAYGAAADAFLEPARGSGVRAVDGIGLLAAQGARSFEFWLGIPAPKEAMLRAVL